MKLKGKHTLSLKWQMGGIVLVCWLIPVLMVLGVMGWYIADSLSQRAAAALSDQFQVNLQMCADRVDTAVSASRTASLDPTIKDAWALYQHNGLYSYLYQSTQRYLARQYCSDGRFLYAAFTFSEDPEEMRAFAYNLSLGMVYQDRADYWARDAAAVEELAAGLDTAVGFLVREDRLYLVRNVMDSAYHPIGILTLALNTPYFFENLSALPWVSSASVAMNGAVLSVQGDPLEGDWLAAAAPGQLTLGAGRSNFLWERTAGSGYELRAAARVDYTVLLGQSTGYVYLLAGMAVLLIPLLLFTFRFLRRKVSQPVEVLMGGAREVEHGKLGFRLDYDANSQEFQYLTASFNQMSGQLRNQFDKLYQEELALRDASIKALQSHINPHFLNNTLEIINWEARMNGDAKVSKMIEALTTVLDAALDRDRRPEVRLSEEMVYVRAYLYIISERFGKRLSVDIDLPEELMDAMVPRLVLQPVIENAVEHGVAASGRGKVAIRGRREGDLLLLEIENDGGMSQEDEARIAGLLSTDYDTMKKACHSIGIANVNQRLRILYGGRSGLSIRGGADGLVTAVITIDRSTAATT